MQRDRAEYMRAYRAKRKAETQPCERTSPPTTAKILRFPHPERDREAFAEACRGGAELLGSLGFLPDQPETAPQSPVPAPHADVVALERRVAELEAELRWRDHVADQDRRIAELVAECAQWDQAVRMALYHALADYRREGRTVEDTPDGLRRFLTGHVQWLERQAELAAPDPDPDLLTDA